MWFRRAAKPNGERYYEYMLCYVDDIIGASHQVKELFGTISSRFTFKDGEGKEPDMYLGADITKWTIDGDDPTKTR